MPWYEKHQPTPFDSFALPGLYFLIGDRIGSWTVGKKLPVVEFPSGVPANIWESLTPDNPLVHVSGELAVSLYDTRDSAYAHVTALGEMLGYRVKTVDADKLAIWTFDMPAHFVLTYDNTAKRLLDVDLVPDLDGPPERERPLLDKATWEQLPPLNSQERLGSGALAQVKFFTPDAEWMWYASEASALLNDRTYIALPEVTPDDPRIVDVIFVGLVQGLVLEYGSFSLSELLSLRGPQGFPIERDQHFTPQTLQSLEAFHEQHNRGA